MYSSFEDPITNFGFQRGFGEQFELGERLGAGAFAIVHAATNKKTGERWVRSSLPPCQRPVGPASCPPAQHFCGLESASGPGGVPAGTMLSPAGVNRSCQRRCSLQLQALCGATTSRKSCGQGGLRPAS